MKNVDSSGQQVYTDDSSNGGSGAYIDVNGNYQCHTDYQNAASSYQYHTQYQQQTSYDPNQQQEPIYYATLPEGAQFGQIYVDQDGNQIIFQPAPQYHMSDENYEHYQYQTVDPNQLIHCQQQNPPNAQGQQLPQPEMELPENTDEPSSVE